MRTQIIPLVGTGAETIVGVDRETAWTWQVQEMDGKPLTHLEHYGFQRGSTLVLPPIARHFHYRLVLVVQG